MILLFACKLGDICLTGSMKWHKLCYLLFLSYQLFFIQFIQMMVILNCFKDWGLIHIDNALRFLLLNCVSSISVSSMGTIIENAINTTYVHYCMETTSVIFHKCPNYLLFLSLLSADDVELCCLWWPRHRDDSTPANSKGWCYLCADTKTCRFSSSCLYMSVMCRFRMQRESKNYEDASKRCIYWFQICKMMPDL